MLKSFYASLDEIPENYQDLFEEKNGGYHLTGVEGIKTQADINRLTVALNKERKEHEATKTKLNDFRGERTLEEIQADLDRIQELEAAAADKIDDEKINSMVESRLRTKLAPVERERDQLKASHMEALEKITAFETTEKRRKIHDAVRPLSKVK